MSNIICSLCRGDHTYEEHMQADRDIAAMPHPSKTRHLLSWDNGSGKVSATFHGETEVDRAWRTIPRDQPGVTPPVERPVLAPRHPARSPLLTPANIATATATAAMVAMFAAIILAWFFDWKMP